MSLIVKTPGFWFRKNHPAALALAPFGHLYGLAVRARFAYTTPCRSRLPVICIGNFTAGGGGKTPLALEVSRLLQENGYRPVFLTRGYGGRERGPHLVEPGRDDALRVGDEPLILAECAPVVVSADRVAGARFIEQMQADVIVMDDGFQNPALFKDLSLVVVDAASGVGNGHLFPAGPLRASLPFQLAKTDALVINGLLSGDRGKDRENGVAALSGTSGKEVFHAVLEARGEVDWLRGARVHAVTGIARPEKFYDSLEQLGAVILEKHEFPDHHMFSEAEAQRVLHAARDDRATPVMTLKDQVRLRETGQRGRLRKTARVLRVEMVINEAERLRELLENAISSATQDGV